MRLYHAVFILIVFLIVLAFIGTCHAAPSVSNTTDNTMAKAGTQSTQTVTVSVPSSDTVAISPTLTLWALSGATLVSANGSKPSLTNVATVTWTDTQGVTQTKDSNTLTFLRPLTIPNPGAGGRMDVVVGVLNPGETATVVLKWAW